jgi:ribosomal protein S18 acetylase RimI-like enzyme
MTIQVRSATTDDAPAIARVNVESWQAAYRGIVSDRFLREVSVDVRERAWRDRVLSDPSRLTLVAERDGEVLGYCGLSTPSRDEDAAFGVAEIAAVYVHPDAWRTGAGGALMESALAALRDAGWRVATLWVFEANLRARGFYERYGFTLDGSRQGHPELGPNAAEVRLRLTLWATGTQAVAAR